MKKTIKLIITILLCIVNSFTAALSLKANVGVGAFDACFATIANTTGIKVGTMLILLCASCILISIVLLGKKTKITILLQMVLPLIGGYVVNFFFYNVLKFEISSYPLRLITFIFSNVLSAFAVAGFMHCNILIYPLEGTCDVIAAKTNKSFKFVRQAADIILISASLIISFLFKVPVQVREGTVISALIFGPLIAFFKKYYERVIK